MFGILMPMPVMNNELMIQLARWVIALVWVFHGLIPKLIYIAPTEWYLSSQFGFSEANTYWLIIVAGTSEILFGVLFFIAYRSKWVNYANIMGLMALIVMVAILDWHYLFTAFNPITTNVPLLVLSVFLISNAQKRME